MGCGMALLLARLEIEVCSSSFCNRRCAMGSSAEDGGWSPKIESRINNFGFVPRPVGRCEKSQDRAGVCPPHPPTPPERLWTA